ncbi:tRNA (N(6)-L-threonylcarbamoyladenosine(37)-C(2))-methylthiotransferase MtaB [Thiospirochaeta perfilievii]|nr:tRNA (N(6)-L-threonylcarbamoyladenosine(37)-C(2))-methylthiotransferase MtaB [Thiospirochaeta perfilievii]
MSKRVALNTLGCKMNQYESDSLASDFIKAGYTVVPFDEKADVYIINTCTVTNKSDRKSRNSINKARKQDDAVVVVTGCYVDSTKQDLEANTGITFLIENKRKNQIFQMVDAYFNGELTHDNRKDDVFDFHTTDRGLRTRATIKIQDGCDSFCSYCIIPYVRGGGISRPNDDIISSIKNHLDEGFKEIVLTGINMSCYDYNGVNFIQLIKSILDIEGDWRLRISSLEPDMMGDEIVELFKHPRMTPHLHLCLQSGSEKILKDMKRTYTFSQYKSIIEKIRRVIPNFNVTTDLIVGFPTESEELFEKSLLACKEIGFGHIHTFKYSKREGTKAAEIKNQVEEKIKTKRSEIVRDVALELKKQYRESLIGLTQRVLVEKVKDGICSGFGENYVPVIFHGDSSMYNKFVNVKIIELEGDKEISLKGEAQ